MAEKKKLAGFFRQMIILFWKNGKLFQRNKSGTFAELLMAVLFILILVAIRFFIDVTAFDAQTTSSNPAQNILASAKMQPGKSKIYYYPNNTFIRSIVLNSYLDILGQNSNFTCLGIEIKNIYLFNYFENVPCCEEWIQILFFNPCLLEINRI